MGLNDRPVSNVSRSQRCLTYLPLVSNILASVLSKFPCVVSAMRHLLLVGFDPVPDA